jgi:hypothetical protein
MGQGFSVLVRGFRAKWRVLINRNARIAQKTAGPREAFSVRPVSAVASKWYHADPP